MTRCSGCKFYVPDERPDYADKFGRCHRHPPTLVFMTFENGGGDWGQDYPYMDKDEWCGEFQPRADSQ